KKALFIGVAALVFVDFYTPVTEATPVRLAPVYEIPAADAASAREAFAILDIPWNAGWPLMHQTLHGIPTMQGYVGRKYGTPLIGRIPFEPDRLALQKAILARHQVKYIVIQKKALAYTPAGKADLERYEAGLRRIAEAYASVYERMYEDEDAALYRVYS
ncbi:MAG: hypothetical protein HQL11_06780, partial [Candidatus Omnitrophica bacterium]|nr:hypothetical protein [Candidatus Omnitrophota bacterium]